MVHGRPDWWGTNPKDVTHGLADMAELAARLGSIVRWDRRGDVILCENFETGTGTASIGGTGDGPSYGLCSSKSAIGTFSLMLSPGTPAGSQAYAYWWLPRPALSKLGGEIWFNLSSLLRYVYFRMTYYDGVKAHHGEIRYSISTDSLDYIDTSGDWASLATNVGASLASDITNVCKLVVDILNDKYVRLIFNHHTYLMDDIDLYIYDSTGAPALRVGYTCENGSDTFRPDNYIDSLIVTQNES